MLPHAEGHLQLQLERASGSPEPSGAVRLPPLICYSGPRKRSQPEEGWKQEGEEHRDSGPPRAPTTPHLTATLPPLARARCRARGSSNASRNSRLWEAGREETGRD